MTPVKASSFGRRVVPSDALIEGRRLQPSREDCLGDGRRPRGSAVQNPNSRAVHHRGDAFLT